MKIADFKNKDVADLGAGTGRLTCMVAEKTKSIVAVDFAADMLKLTARKLSQMNLTNWKTSVSDLRQLPLAINCPDIEYTYAYLKDKGIPVEDLHTLGAGEAKYFYFRDNEGNLLEAAWSIWDPKDEIKEDFMK